MQINTVLNGDVAVLTLGGNFLCEPDKFKLRDSVYELMDGQIVKVVIDFSEVHCMNSEGLGTLVMALTSLRKSGGDVRLAHVSDMVRKTLAITQLNRVSQVYDTVELAVASYEGMIKPAVPTM